MEKHARRDSYRRRWEIFKSLLWLNLFLLKLLLLIAHFGHL